VNSVRNSLAARSAHASPPKAIRPEYHGPDAHAPAAQGQRFRLEEGGSIVVEVEGPEPPGGTALVAGADFVQVDQTQDPPRGANYLRSCSA